MMDTLAVLIVIYLYIKLIQNKKYKNRDKKSQGSEAVAVSCSMMAAAGFLKSLFQSHFSPGAVVVFILSEGTAH